MLLILCFLYLQNALHFVMSKMTHTVLGKLELCVPAHRLSLGK